MTIHDWVTASTILLTEKNIASARLDAEIILAHTLKKSRTWLHMYGDEGIDPRLRDIADARIDLRSDYTPIAYIIGHTEFYGRSFFVTPRVLVPSPETEALIELTLSLRLPPNAAIVDVGCGSGIIGITLAAELQPTGPVQLVDISEPCLAVARKNAKHLKVDPFVRIHQSDLLHGYEPIDQRYPLFNLVIANLPYVDTSWSVGPEIHHEPSLALYAKQHGLSLIQNLIEQASRAIKPGGNLILEADPRQHVAIIRFATEHTFRHQRTLGYGLLFTK